VPRHCHRDSTEFSGVWAYTPSLDDGRVIVADDKLRQVFGKDQATMFEMNKLLAQHLK